ncbi:MAG: glycosyltransferase family 4 protein, partial [Candidatus Hodarchaeota archaeon]
MRITLVATLFDPNRGHTLPFYNLAKGLTFFTDEVTCYYSSNKCKKEIFSVKGRKFVSVGVPSRIFKIKNTFFSFSPQLFRSLLNSTFDLVHTHEYVSINSLIAFIVAIFRRKPILVTTPLYLPTWGTKWGYIGSIICHILAPFINIIASKIICASTTSYQTHIRLGFQKSKLCIVP